MSLSKELADIDFDRLIEERTAYTHSPNGHPLSLDEQLEMVDIHRIAESYPALMGLLHHLKGEYPKMGMSEEGVKAATAAASALFITLIRYAESTDIQIT